MERFISQPLTPHLGEAFPAPPGGPALPRRFRWSGGELAIRAVLESWRETGPCRHGSGERYVRKHGWRVALEHAAAENATRTAQGARAPWPENEGAAPPKSAGERTTDLEPAWREARLYFERTVRRGASPHERWWLYSLSTGG